MSHRIPEHLRGAYQHATTRLRERYGLTLGPVQYQRLCAELARIPWQGERVHASVVIAGRLVPCMFAVQDAVIVTFLPPPDPPKSRASRQGYKGHKPHRPRRYTRRWQEEDG